MSAYACAYVKVLTSLKLLETEKGEHLSQVQPCFFDNIFRSFVKSLIRHILTNSASVIQDGELTTKNLSLSLLMTTLPSSETNVTQRLSSGTKFALGQWLKVLHPVPKKSLPWMEDF